MLGLFVLIILGLIGLARFVIFALKPLTPPLDNSHGSIHTQKGRMGGYQAYPWSIPGSKCSCGSSLDCPQHGRAPFWP